MPFLAKTHHPIPTKDILSWYFDSPIFDQHRPLYIDAEDVNRFWTAEQCRKAIKQLAAGFKAQGLEGWPDKMAQSSGSHAGSAPLPNPIESHGDTVCMLSFNELNYPILVNGILGFGGVYTGANPAYTAYELAHHLKSSDTKFVIAEPDLLPNLLKAAEEVGLRRDRILIFDNHGEQIPEGFRSWRTLFDHGEMEWPSFDNLQMATETTAALLYSSGTTGLPKPVMLTHRNFIAAQTLFNEWQPVPWHRRRLLMLPMFHTATAPLAHFSPLRSGDTIFTMRRFELESYLAMMQKHQITEGAFVPPMVHMIISSPLMKTDKYQNSLKTVMIGHTGAAPLDRESQTRLIPFLNPKCVLTQVFGMTETSAVCCMTPWNAPEAYEAGKWGSVGQMLPDIDAKLVDEDGKDITAYDTRGELCVRGPLIVKSYYKNDEANARDWDEDGFFHTGDVAYRDSKTTHWFIVTRKKEMIKVRGFQVAPIELEAALLAHPDIIDAAVIGVPSAKEVDGEAPRAYIVVRPEMKGKVTAEIVHSYMKERLARYKQITGGIVFTDSIPKTMSGKFLKRILKEEYQKEMAEAGKGESRAKM